MNKTYKFPALWMMCLMLFSCLTFTACDNGDDEDTNQYKGGISLNVFGPSPVSRGGVLRFLGSGMDKVTAVVIPGCDDITDIEVVSDTEIRVTVPQTAQPGLVVLKTPKGDITTKTELTFTEPIALEAFAPAEVKPGSELTITGEYLNLIKEVIFADEVTVPADEFVSQSRQEIKVIVPDSAQTGKFILSDGAEIPNWIYSEGELEVTLPSVEAPLDLVDKKPGDVIRVSGKNFDLVKKVQMPNGDEVEFTMTASSEGDELTFTLPDNVSDGEVTVLPASDVKVVVATVVVATPSNVVAVPAVNLRGGDMITLKGTNMDLVTDVTFPGVEEAVGLESQNSTEIKVLMPAAAISGDLQLNTNSGKATAVSIATAKPENISYSAATVPAGEALTVKGINMDVVSAVVFSGNVEVTVSDATATAISLTVPTTAETGALLLKMANGESVEAPSLTIEKPVCAYLPALPDKLVRGRIVELEIVNADKLTNVLLNEASVQYINDAAKGVLMLNVPAELDGTYSLKLISSNGEIAYDVLVVANEETVWAGPLDISWGDGGRVLVPAVSFAKVTAGTVMKVYFDQKDQTWAQAQFNYGDWSGITFSLFDTTMVPTDIYGWSFESRVMELTLTQEILDNIQAKQGDCEDQTNVGIIIQGSDLTFTKITIVN
ncbi:hypothetical protein DW096_11100 [Bacteroides sp. AM07-18]|jgi:hypothetical protein|uniref:IPT/TIG domain-containing protein n=1 Tax=Bacteroides uniformis TaxID=820 RepID=A0A414JP30_BACUN|nr:MULTISPECIES: hypothetical protein [Bacteroides]RGD53272.1 hypothetical protein DW096_11100 [Bacteroides sp. AM07-18]RHE59861.1 hypothetical protein DW729_10550 [Bacteroides uniformis]RJU28252.1 hypothetical protein DW995_08670 [Bacteroides sp. AM51-7]RJU76221.1 hypothetical protein DW699_10905 [Bacteroides sp. AM26-2]